MIACGGGGVAGAPVGSGRVARRPLALWRFRGRVEPLIGPIGLRVSGEFRWGVGRPAAGFVPAPRGIETVAADPLETCQDLLGHRFHDLSLLARALTHSSLAPTRAQSNERMEFLGDAVLGLIVCHELFQRYENLMEGALTQIKSAVVSRQTCAQIADEIGLTELVRLGKGMPDSASGDLPTSVPAAVLEAVIGAVYLDGGLEAVRPFVLRCVEPHVAAALVNEHQENYKSLLQHHAQRRWSQTPEYELLDEKGPDHSKCFEIAVSIRGRQFPSAWGQSKKEAEQNAARRALQHLGLLDVSEPADGAEPADAES